MLRPRAWWNAPDELRRSRARSRNSIRCRLGRLATPCDVSTRCHTPSSQRRAAMVEFALVFPILLAIPVGTVTAGMADNLNNSLNGGARESSRSATTLPVNGDTTAWLNSVADVAPDSTSGDLDASVPGQQICVSSMYADGTAGDHRTTSLVEIAGVRAITVGSTSTAGAQPWRPAWETTAARLLAPRAHDATNHRWSPSAASRPATKTAPGPR